MSDESETPLESAFCRHLRSKKYFFLTAVPTHEDDLREASNYFWCSLRMQCLGPDGERVHPQGCRSTRACYQSQFEVST